MRKQFKKLEIHIFVQNINKQVYSKSLIYEIGSLCNIKLVTVKLQSKVGPNEQKTITDAKQETEPSLTKAQKKKLQIEYQKQFIQQQRTKEGIKAAQPQEIANLYRDLQNQINQEATQVPNQVNKTMLQRQPSPRNANTTDIQQLVQPEENNEQRGENQKYLSQQQKFSYFSIPPQIRCCAQFVRIRRN
ncbi:Hypothetical_protein [Hexamita inflata]|uniref:Hypothetical_protein n=1 Tax=Hexamita inflata TaxID=28002 RepID=A0AA86N484_9EUKA|nr:Hypothetical protein HINF_LOCUS113 [Hexamita inflata]